MNLKYQEKLLENQNITGEARPRLNARSGNVYTPTKTKNYEYLTRFYFTQKYREYIPAEGRVKISIIAYFDIPKSTSKKKEAEMLENRISPTKKPDIDNITKVVLDALNKFAYKDDTQITEITVVKKYASTPKVKIKKEE
mgnify:CR=1 FL=1